MPLFVNEDGLVEKTVAASVEPGDGKLVLGLLKGKKLEITSIVTRNGNTYYQFDPAGVSGFRIQSFPLGSLLWVLAEGNPTAKAKTTKEIDTDPIGSMVTYFDAEGVEDKISIRFTSPLEEEIEMADIAGSSGKLSGGSPTE